MLNKRKDLNVDTFQIRSYQIKWVHHDLNLDGFINFWCKKNEEIQNLKNENGDLNEKLRISVKNPFNRNKTGLIEKVNLHN